MRLWPRRAGTSLDLLVVGLGNPGREHAGNRHNVGWMIADELARRHDGAWRSKFSGRLAELRIGEHRVAVLKPETYMNESGRSVSAAARFFKVEPDAILVVHDESDLELGRLQARFGGGLAGHNGLRSIARSEEHTSELQSRGHLVCRLLLEKKKHNPRICVSSLTIRSPRAHSTTSRIRVGSAIARKSSSRSSIAPSISILFFF